MNSLSIIFIAILFSQTPVESVVASLNNRSITYSELLQEGELLNIENNVPPETPLSADLKKKVLKLLIFRIITFEEARSQEVTVDEKLINQKVETYRKNIYMKDFLAKYDISDLELKTIIKMRLTADKMTELFLEKRFREKSPSAAEKKKAVEDWQENLFKRQKLLEYPIP